MITEIETNKYRKGALSVVDYRKRVMKKGRIEVGKKFICNPLNDHRWNQPFFGIVEFIYNKSATVIITATDQSDDALAASLKGRTVVPFKNMIELD